MAKTKEEARQCRKIRIRKKVVGNAERPRLVVYRSNMHIYAQIVDDAAHHTVVSTSTLVLNRAGGDLHRNKQGAGQVGKEIARLAREQNISRVVFDRNGYLYHGCIKAVADGAREAGLEF